MPVAFVAAISFLGVASELLHDATNAASEDDGVLRLMSFNVHQYFDEPRRSYNLESAVELLRGENADVVGLQESDGARITSGHVDGVRYLAHGLGYESFYGPPSSFQIYGVSVLSRFPIRNPQVFSLPAEESIERVAVLVEIEAPLGTVPVLVTHLQTEEFAKDRLAQVERILEIARSHPRLIVLGDFNTPPDPEDSAYTRLSGEFTDACAPTAERPNGGGETSPASAPIERIDYVFLRGAWNMLECWTAGSPRVSDHLAVVASVQAGA